MIILAAVRFLSKPVISYSSHCIHSYKGPFIIGGGSSVGNWPWQHYYQLLEAVVASPASFFLSNHMYYSLKILLFDDDDDTGGSLLLMQ